MNGLGGISGSNNHGGFPGSGGLGGISGIGGLSGPEAMLGVAMPSATAGMENVLIAAADSGEMSGMQLMLYMFIMMMQMGDSSNEFAPIIQMVANMMSQNQSTQPQSSQPAGVPLNKDSEMMWEENTDQSISRMVDIALGQVGYRERNRDGSFGSGNMTQFGAWYGMDGQPWCAMFVSWAADKAGVLHDVVPKHASTSRGVAAYQEKGKYAPQGSGYIPREGDAIYFRSSSGQVRHVGIVVAFDPDTQRVYTVEGNTSNAVRVRHYELNNPRIHGYGRNGGTGNGRIPLNSSSGVGASTI